MPNSGKKPNRGGTYRIHRSRPHSSDADNWVERTLNSPKFFYGALGVLCSCYVTFAALDHMAAKHKRATEISPVNLQMEFAKKPKIKTPAPSEYGGLHYIKGETPEKAPSSLGTTAGEQIADAKIDAASGEKDPNRDIPDLSDLLPAGTVVKKAQGFPDATSPRTLQTIKGLGGSSSGGSFGGGISAGAQAKTSSSDDAPQLAALGPMTRPMGAAAGLRGMQAIGQGGKTANAGTKGASGVRGGDALPPGVGASGPRTSASETLAETADTAITGEGAASGGATGAGSDAALSSQREGRKTGTSGTGGGNNGAGGGTTANPAAIQDPNSCVTIQTVGGGTRTVCPDGSTSPSSTNDPTLFNSDNDDPFGGDPFANEFGPITGDAQDAQTEFFTNKTAEDRVKEVGEGIFDVIAGGIGGIARWWQEDVVPGNSILRGISDAANSTVDWIDNGINWLFGKNPLDPANRTLHNALKGAYEAIAGENNASRAPDLKRDLLNSDVIYRYQRDMHAELKNVSPKDKKRYNEIIQKYQRKFIMEALPEYIDQANRNFDEREAAILRNCREQCYDLGARIDALDRERTAFNADYQQLPMTQIAMEFTSKLIGGNGPQNSERQRQIELQGIKCDADQKIVAHPHTGKLACTFIDGNPLSRAWTWFGHLFVDGSDWLKERAKDSHNVSKNGTNTGADWLTGITSAIVSPFAWLGGEIGRAITGGSVIAKGGASSLRFDANGLPAYSRCGEGTRDAITPTGTICVDKKTGQPAGIDANGVGVPSSILNAAASAAPKAEEKKGDKGFFGWVSDGFSSIAKGIGGLFGMADSKEDVLSAKPQCAAHMTPVEVGGAWSCMPKTMFEDALPASKGASPAALEESRPSYNYASKPKCMNGYFPKQYEKTWTCVRTTQPAAPSGPSVRIGEGDTVFSVTNCPSGTRKIVTNIPRKGDAACMQVKSKGPGIFMPTNNPYRPWLELSKCPASMETVLSHKPAPNDMTCRTPVGPRAGDQIRYQKTLNGYSK